MTTWLAAATANQVGPIQLWGLTMSERDYTTVRKMSLREAMDPTNRDQVKAYFKRECCLVAWYGFLRSIGEAIQ